MDRANLYRIWEVQLEEHIADQDFDGVRRVRAWAFGAVMVTAGEDGADRLETIWLAQIKPYRIGWFQRAIFVRALTSKETQCTSL